ncbi:HAD family hydrolase [Planktothrix agardhii]|jgi:HAD superfamily hydrolase (TIGR01509 family)|uniref:Haloacid dehalogenase-like hydrolase n=3 Tax=Planktothrix agardhii TaxID=1160 RepID=A0A073CY77_PLAA1|nr:HAD family hydrolase [Planktothrix agardhii]MCF3605412.1 HAD family hydrolase [Planktothrix agardhii 1033]KEI69000.1 Haloacid dehalogenase-like hydrolase [Planktothrix agardhii NIVA-CYA 126/8]MBG0745442.1 HAD family hydrolase [Planktothrix agardhii KL2]MCB8749410.1 HAD family hydrolase [Planktothrix agardhii 1810]MCB8758169.1 HAD family hydrolase [Planktothrix agardhii 1813]
MGELKALIFDVDGTLADTERDGHRIAFNQAFFQVGLSWNWSVDLYGELLAIGGGKERIRYYIEKYEPDFLLTEKLDDLIRDLHQLKNEYYRKLLDQGSIPLRPGAQRLIQEAKEHRIRLAIATTSALPNVLALLENTAIHPDWFEIIAAGDIVSAKKPAPDIYFYVLEKLGLNAADCLVFEDSYHGFSASKQAGLKTIITVNDYTKNQDFTDALLVVNHLGKPDQPFTVLAGKIPQKCYLDLALISSYFC